MYCHLARFCSFAVDLLNCLKVDREPGSLLDFAFEYKVQISICMSVVYDYQVTDMDGSGMFGVAETPGMWDTLHITFDCSRETLGTIGGGGWGRFVA